MTAMLVGIVAVLLAGYLALAEAATAVSRAYGEPPAPNGLVPMAHALLVARLALLTVAGIAGGTATVWWDRPAAPAVGTLLLATGLGYLAAEALPTALGRLAQRLAVGALPGARAVLVPFRPLIWIVARLDRLASRAFPRGRARPGELGAPQRDMLSGVRSLRDTTVADVMTPRLDIVGLEADTSWTELIERVRRNDHSRLPVYDDSLDAVIGILHVKDLAPCVVGTTPPPPSWHDLVRPVSYVPEAKTLAAQLGHFQRGASHLAIVVDEYGGTSGLVTLEDILEEVVGEIHDEHDLHEAPQIERDGEGRFWVDGRLPVDDLASLLGSSIAHEDVSTVGGLIYTELGRVPQPGEELRIDGYRVVVEQVVRRRIRRVYFEAAEAERPDADPEPGTPS